MTTFKTRLLAVTLVSALGACQSLDMPDDDMPPPASSYELPEEVVTTPNS